MEHRELVILGAGPAGLTAALYAKRAGMDALVLEKGAVGGQMTATRSLLDLFRAKNTKTRTNFFSAGLSMSIMVRITGLEPAQSCNH